MTLDMFGPRVAPMPETIDLRCCGADTMLGTLDTGTVDLVIADPPWGQYEQEVGVAKPERTYPTLSDEDIGGHLRQGVRVLRPGGRLAMWTCWPLLVEVLAKGALPPWLDVPGLRWVSGGAWSKGTLSSVGVGYHWRGRSEPVLLGVKDGGAAGRAFSMLYNTHESEPEQHSRKPAPWQASWIEAWVPPGGLVVDPYAGLGSVAEAVVLAGEGRRYVGAEIDPTRHAKASAFVRRAVVRGAP